MTIQVGTQELGVRPQQVQQLLAPLVGTAPRIDPSSLAGVRSYFAYLGQRPATPRDSQFPCSTDRFVAAYYESWEPTSRSQTEFQLRLSHLHLSAQTRGGGLAQIIALHCESTGPYPSKPHFHISISPYPVRRAHFLADLSDIDLEYSSFVTTMAAAVKLIAAEILGHENIADLLTELDARVREP